MTDDRILAALAEAPPSGLTVRELVNLGAGAFAITVAARLRELEREGLVRPVGGVRGTGQRYQLAAGEKAAP